MACGPPLSPGVRAGEGPGVGALPPAGRHVCCLWRSRGIQDGVGALGAGAWGGWEDTRDTPLPPSCAGDHGIREDVVPGELHPL